VRSTRSHQTARTTIPTAILRKSVWRGLGRSQARFLDSPHPRYGESFPGASILAYQTCKKLIPGNLHEKPDSRADPRFAFEITGTRH
jgi:hypothetical protein